MEHGQIVRGGHDGVEKGQGLLGHGEVHQVRLERLQLSRKAELVPWIEGKLRIAAGEGMEIAGPHFPVVIRLHQDGVAVVGIDVLKVFDQTIGIPAGAGATVAGVNNDVFPDQHSCYNYNQEMQILTRIPYFGGLILLAYMPFHIFLSQSLSLATGGLEVWKLGKDLVLFLLALFTICLVFWQGKASRVFKVLIGFTAFYGLLHLGLWVLRPELYDRTAALGTIYNMRLPLCAIIGAGAVLLLPRFSFRPVLKLLLVVSTAVAGLGVLQYFLPSDLLTHFGYSLERGTRAAFFIDDNPLFPRIMSTLREPNALGAYLVLPTTLLSLLLFRVKDINKRYMIGGALGLHGLAIMLTQSRSAWAALIVSLTLAFLWQHHTWFTAFVRRFWYVAVALAVMITSGIFLLRDTHFIQGYIIHTSEARTSEIDSNEYHTLLIRQGLEGMVEKPLGHGPGTAGLVSIQNPNGGQLTENYYVQVGYEVGIIGLTLFIALNVWLYRLLWRRGDYLGAAMCAAFWAYLLTNMLLHTWSNEAVATQWWIVAGMLATLYNARK